jgi:hypothetical protein
MFLSVEGGEGDWLNAYKASDWHQDLPDVGDQVDFGPGGKVANSRWSTPGRRTATRITTPGADC